MIRSLIILLLLTTAHADEPLTATPAATAASYLSAPDQARQAGLRQAKATDAAYTQANNWKTTVGMVWGVVTMILGGLAGMKTLQARRIGTTLRHVSGYVEDLKPYVDQVIGKDERKRLADQRYDRADRDYIAQLRSRFDMKQHRPPDYVHLPAAAGLLPESDSHLVATNVDVQATDACPEARRT